MRSNRGDIVKATWLMAAALVAAGSTAHAQDVPLQEMAAPQAAKATPVNPSARPAPAVDRRRDDIRMMEKVLTTALEKGAQDLARQLKVSEPNSAFVTSTGRARGFALEGYGMFFDVDVPGMRQSVVWSAQMLELAQQRDQLREFLAQNPTHPARRVAEANLRQIERMMIGVPGPGPLPIPSPAPASPPRGIAVASDLADATSVPPAVTAPVPELRDPNELYTDSVKNALIDAMLRYSAFLKIADNEWLTVAASDSDGPQIPGQLDDASRIIIRVKGSDLSAFQAGKLTREEVMKRVDVKEF
jgi:hypothetical protein